MDFITIVLEKAFDQWQHLILYHCSINPLFSINSTNPIYQPLPTLSTREIGRLVEVGRDFLEVDRVGRVGRAGSRV